MKNNPSFTNQINRIVLIASVILGLGMVSSTALAQEGEGAKTGTDPRDFAPKFMPYYRYTETENGLENHSLTLFGLFAFSKKLAMTYEIPIGYKTDVGDTDLKKPDGTCGGSISPGQGLPPIPTGGFEGDCQETGIGDMNLRFMYRTDSEALGGDWIVGMQIDLPTASDDLLGSEQVALGPMFAYIRDIPAWPGPGAFFALMNFYFFDAFGEDDRDDVSRYVGRWFVMLPLSKPGPNFLDGWYLLPEFQPVYDFEESHFSFWAAPELGKVLGPGNIVYFKPGWGVDPDEDEGDRDVTLEVGWRYFLD